jgi:hypothetical protein
MARRVNSTAIIANGADQNYASNLPVSFEDLHTAGQAEE